MSVRGWLWVLAMSAVFPAQATVSLTGTRLIISAGSEASIEARNRSDHEVLVQAWLGTPGDDNDPQTAQPRADLPFVVTPALVRLPAAGRHLLRVLYHGKGMSEARESLLHLYVLEVPRRHVAQQQLTIAVRQRVNVFYRPPGLPGDPAEAAAQLRWSLAPSAQGERRLQVHNPTAFHVALLDVRLDDRAVKEYLLLAPDQQVEWPAPAGAAQQLLYKALTDYGGPRGYCAHATGQGPFSARLLDTSSITEDC